MIIIDSNESGTSDMERRIRKLFDNDREKVDVKPLNHGEDYIVDVNDIQIPIQRKEGKDYVASIQDDRLNNELYEMSTHYHLSLLIVEGSISYALSQRGFKRQPYIGALASSILKRSPEGKKGQIVTVNLETEFDTAMFVYCLHDNLEEGLLERVPRISGRKSDPEKAKLALLQQIPQIGKKRARKIHDNFGSIKDLFEVEVEELQDCLGPTIGKKVYNFLREV